MYFVSEILKIYCRIWISSTVFVVVVVVVINSGKRYQIQFVFTPRTNSITNKTCCFFFSFAEYVEKSGICPFPTAKIDLLTTMTSPFLSVFKSCTNFAIDKIHVVEILRTCVKFVNNSAYSITTVNNCNYLLADRQRDGRVLCT